MTEEEKLITKCRAERFNTEIRLLVRILDRRDNAIKQLWALILTDEEMLETTREKLGNIIASAYEVR